MVDPDGHTEVSAADCQKDSRCVTVAINVIVDPNANVDQAKLDQQIDAIKGFYGDANIHFEVSQVSGTVSEETLQPNAINLAIVNQTPTLDEGTSTVTKSGYAITWLSARDSNADTAIHELAHHFLGHTTGWFNAVASNELALYSGVGLFMKGFAEARVGMLEFLGPTNVASRTGNLTPRSDIVEGAKMFAPGGVAYRRQ